MRVPEPALAACASAAARALHIGPPLPEPPELQEMIGAAAEIAGAREMTPQTMARLLLFADPRPTVMLAIDEAHELSHGSLCYLTLMTELLAAEAPILQIVLAAAPDLLDTLAQPEFESLRNRLCRPAFETFQTLHGRRAGFSGLRPPAYGRAAASLAYVHYADQTAASAQDDGIARVTAYAAGGVVVMGLLTVIGYIAFSAFTAGPTFPPIPSLDQPGAAGDRDQAASPSNAAAPSPPSAAPDRDIDLPQPAMATAAPAAPARDAIAPVPPSAAPDHDVDLPPPAMAEAAPARPALDAVAPASPSAAPDQDVDLPPTMGKATPDGAAAPSGDQPRAAGDGDQAALSPNAVAPAPAATEQDVDLPPASNAKAAAAPDGAAAQVAAGLPPLAPVRVILNSPRDDAGSARRSADIQRALAAAGLEVSNLVPVDAQRPGPSIGYYFQSDLNAAAEVSRLLEPLLGAVNPVALRKRGSIPEPGTIEIEIP